MLSLKTHNILDYVGGALAILLSGAVAAVNPARNLFLVVGFGVIIYSLFTNYRYSISKLIPVGVHMALDIAGGVLLLVGPWLFGYSGLLTGGQTALHLILGGGLVGLVLFTSRRTETGWETLRREIKMKQTKRELEGVGRR